MKKSRRFDHGEWEAIASQLNVVAIDAEDFEEALRIAKEIAANTGLAVTVRDAEMIELEAVPAPKKN